MKTYLVGGAVRDALMARSHGEAAPRHADRDWVVVGATPESMVARGFLPVGRDFPVFLHPQTREEYALARTERKSGRGYHGFVFHTDAGVTLEEDLARRDLTINAMAVAAEEAQDPSRAALIDPYHGHADLSARVLRHVTEAFAEDPVRLLRVARFAARWPDFHVAPETMALMRQMVDSGEVDHLVPERVWQEMSRGLMEQRPSRMFEVLGACGALSRLIDVPLQAPASLDMAAQLHAPLTVRFACLCRGLETPAQVNRLCDHWRVPNDCRALAAVLLREHAHIAAAANLDSQGMLALLERCDAIRKPARFDELLLSCAVEMRAAAQDIHAPHLPGMRLREALVQALAVNTAEVAAEAQRRGLIGAQVGACVHAARLSAIAAWLVEADRH